MIVAGLAIAGLGIANIVPVLFSAAGNTPGQPAATAVAAVATSGYFGLLAGPPVIGFVAEATSLTAAFLMLGGAIFLVSLAARLRAPPTACVTTGEKERRAGSSAGSALHLAGPRNTVRPRPAGEGPPRRVRGA